MKKAKIKFLCNSCGYETYKWLGKCPSCGVFDSFVEIDDEPDNISEYGRKNEKCLPPQAISSINSSEIKRLKTKIKEFDQLIGGGVVPASLLLLGGKPGIGKSTLILQILNNINKKILYVAGEESPEQIKMRADRLGINNPNLYILPEIDLNKIIKVCHENQFEFLVVDSIQTIFNPAIHSAPGNINQVKDCTLKIMEYSKKNNVTSLIIGHITKTGEFAGPRVLEHMVDTVLYFEGEKNSDFRILRSVKNRFGSTNEIGVFEMRENGLKGLNNYSNLFFFNRKEKIAGIANSVIVEGSRPVIIEIQALVNSAVYGNARRVSNGFDYNRLSVIIAIIEKHCKLSLADKDIFVNITGGLQVDEPVIDLAVAVAIISSLKNRPLDFKTVFIGELGLTGEVRPANRNVERFNLCVKNNITNAIISEQTEVDKKSKINIKLYYINNIKEILKYF